MGGRAPAHAERTDHATTRRPLVINGLSGRFTRSPIGWLSPIIAAAMALSALSVTNADRLCGFRPRPLPPSPAGGPVDVTVETLTRDLPGADRAYPVDPREKTKR